MLVVIVVRVVLNRTTIVDLITVVVAATVMVGCRMVGPSCIVAVEVANKLIAATVRAIIIFVMVSRDPVTVMVISLVIAETGIRGNLKQKTPACD